MALVDLADGSQFFWPPMGRYQTGSGTHGTLTTLDAANEKSAAVFQAPKSGNISKIHWRTGTVSVTSGPLNFDVRLETLGSDGNPTGTLIDSPTNNARANQAVADTDDNTYFKTTLTSAQAVTKGDIICGVISAPASGTFSVVVSGISLNTLYPSALGLPKFMNYVGTPAWASLNNIQIFALEYDDGTIECPQEAYPVKTFSTISISTSTTPDEIGNIINVPFGCRVSGAWMCGSIPNTATFKVKLIDSDGSTIATGCEFSMDDDYLRAKSAAIPIGVLFSGSKVLTKNTDYRIIIEPLTTTSLTVYEMEFDSAAALNSCPGGSSVHRTERTNAGAWSQTTTKRIQIGVMIDQIDDGTSSGGSETFTGSVLNRGLNE